MTTDQTILLQQQNVFTVLADICDLCGSKQCLYCGEKYQLDKAALIKLIFLERGKGKLLPLVLRISRVSYCRGFLLLLPLQLFNPSPFCIRKGHHGVQTDVALPTQVMCWIAINFFSSLPYKILACSVFDLSKSSPCLFFFCLFLMPLQHS